MEQFHSSAPPMTSSPMNPPMSTAPNQGVYNGNPPTSSSQQQPPVGQPPGNYPRPMGQPGMMAQGKNFRIIMFPIAVVNLGTLSYITLM